EPENHSEPVRLPLGKQLLYRFEAAGLALLQAQPHLGLAARPQMKERAFLPSLGRRALSARLIGRHGIIGCLVAAPGDDATLIDGIEGIDNRDGARERQAGLAAALAQTIEQVDLVVAGQTALADRVQYTLHAFRCYRHAEIAPSRAHHRAATKVCAAPQFDQARA